MTSTEMYLETSIQPRETIYEIEQSVKNTERTMERGERRERRGKDGI